MRSLVGDNTVLQEIWDAYPRMEHTAVRNALAAFLFRGDAVEKPVFLLSGGEKARVQLLKLMLSGANLLLLDEPTNHLDIASREALEQALEEYDGALLVVTHDRYLVNRLADRVLAMRQDGLYETIGGYDAYLEEKEAALKYAAEKSEAREERPNEYRAKKERQSAIARAKGAVSRAEAEVERLELEQAASRNNSPSPRPPRITKKQRRLFLRWSAAGNSWTRACAYGNRRRKPCRGCFWSREGANEYHPVRSWTAL